MFKSLSIFWYRAIVAELLFEQRELKQPSLLSESLLTAGGKPSTWVSAGGTRRAGIESPGGSIGACAKGTKIQIFLKFSEGCNRTKMFRHQLKELSSTGPIDRRCHLRILQGTRIWLMNQILRALNVLTLTVNDYVIAQKCFVTNSTNSHLLGK